MRGKLKQLSISRKPQSSYGSVALRTPQNAFTVTAQELGDIQILNRAAQNNSPCTTMQDYSLLSHYQARKILFKLPTSSAPENITKNLNFQNAAL